MCPECRVEHTAPNSAKTFPQNKYILNYIYKLKTKQASLPPKEKMLEKEQAKCHKHSEKVMFFCTNENCKCFICHVCLIQSHKKHDIVDVDQGKEILSKKMEEKLLYLEKTKQKVNKIEEGLKVQDADAKASITACKMKACELFDQMLKCVDKKMEESSEKLNASKDTITTKIRLIQSIKKDLDEAKINIVEVARNFRDTTYQLDGITSTLSGIQLDSVLQTHAKDSMGVGMQFIFPLDLWTGMSK